LLAAGFIFKGFSPYKLADYFTWSFLNHAEQNGNRPVLTYRIALEVKIPQLLPEVILPDFNKMAVPGSISGRFLLTSGKIPLKF
jgi:hypothetical protein